MARVSDVPEHIWNRGEAQIFRFLVYKSNGVDRENITGWTLDWQLRLTDDAAAALLTKTTASGITITDPDRGEYEVALTLADQSGLTVQTYRYGTRRTNTGVERTLAKGDLPLSDCASR